MKYALPFIALLFSIISYQTANKAINITVRENTPNFRIIENLWTNPPYYELVNEATSKLDKIPAPSYLMFVPSKLYYDIDGKEAFSSLILTPISYDSVVEQVVNSETKSSIVKSTLTNNFFAKKSLNEIVQGKKHTTDNDDLSLVVKTLPFLVIVSLIDYEYEGKMEREIILSTPLMNEKLSNSDYNHIQEYIYDNIGLLKITSDPNKSIYQTVHDNVEGLVTKINDPNTPKKDKENVAKIVGAKEGAYGFILKELNKAISPIDPMEEYIKNSNNKN